MRGLTCGIVSSNDTLLASNDDKRICTNAVSQLAGASPQWFTDEQSQKWVQEAKRRGLTCSVGHNSTTKSDTTLLSAVFGGKWVPDEILGTFQKYQKYYDEALRRGLSCPQMSEAEYFEQLDDNEICLYYRDLKIGNGGIIRFQVFITALKSAV